MGGYSKVTMAALAGAVVTILAAVMHGIWPNYTMTPELNSAVQTVITAVAVYLAPANAAPKE
jgi:hypothetical protein